MAASSKQLAGSVGRTRRESKGNPLSRLRSYIDELKREMRLVTWPSRRQVRATTIVVLVTVFFFGVYFGLVDYVLALGQARLYRFLGS